MDGRCWLALLALATACGLEQNGEQNATGGAAGAGGTHPTIDGGGGWVDAAGTGALGGLGGAGGTITSDAAAGAGGTVATGGSTGTGGTIAFGGAGGLPSAVCSIWSPNAVELDINGMIHCYWLSPSAGDYTTAVGDCQQRGAYLATILSSPENDVAASFALAGTRVWLGATDGNPQNNPNVGSYNWITGESWGYTRWASGEPDAFCNDCGAGNKCCQHHLAISEGDGLWHSQYSGEQLQWICESGQLL